MAAGRRVPGRQPGPGELVALLAGPDGNVCVVGDDDQVVHRFRGSRSAAHRRLRRALPEPRGDRAGPQLPQPRGDPRGGLAAFSTTSEGSQKPLIAVRGDGGQVAVVGLATRTTRPTGSPGRSPRRSPPGSRGRRSWCSPAPATPPSRCSSRSPGRDPAPGARQPRAVRAHRGQGRARLPDAAAQPARRAGVPPGDPAHRSAASAPRPPTRRYARARGTRRRPDRAPAPSATDRRHPLARGAQRLVEFGEGLIAVRRELEAGPLARARRARRGDARRRAGPALRAAARPLTERPSGGDAERVLEDLRSLCRAAQAFEEQHGTRT